MVNYDDFKKLDLRVAKVIAAEEPEGSEKILRLTIDLGEEERQILAGIKSTYSPSDLIGKEIIVIANLESKKIMGMESQGMLLAANTENGPILLVPDREVPPGSKIS